tara:strand:+ start:1820 stop:2011 length:192 start_codon:yes stop_codon:yes gene_type:complete
MRIILLLLVCSFSCVKPHAENLPNTQVEDVEESIEVEDTSVDEIEPEGLIEDDVYFADDIPGC